MDQGIWDHIYSIQNRINSDQQTIHNLVEKNQVLFRALATIKTNLERAIKNPQKLLNEAVYNAIDLSRSLTPYTEMSTGLIKIDPPLTIEEKTPLI